MGLSLPVSKCGLVFRLNFDDYATEPPNVDRFLKGSINQGVFSLVVRSTAFGRDSG